MILKNEFWKMKFDKKMRCVVENLVLHKTDNKHIDRILKNILS